MREMLKAKLLIPNDSYEEDANDLLDYAFDMVDDGKDVGSVTEEVSFMHLYLNNPSKIFELCSHLLYVFHCNKTS